jgi:hypothetical protein
MSAVAKDSFHAALSKLPLEQIAQLRQELCDGSGKEVALPINMDSPCGVFFKKIGITSSAESLGCYYAVQWIDEFNRKNQCQ